MPYYKDKENKIHILENEKYVSLLPEGCVEITHEEAATTLSVVSPNDAIITQIIELEQTITPRRMREALLNAAGKIWLNNVELQIAELRKQLT